MKDGLRRTASAPHNRPVLLLGSDADADGRFAFDDRRLFGWIELADDTESYVSAESIGPTCWLSMLTIPGRLSPTAAPW